MFTLPRSGPFSQILSHILDRCFASWGKPEQGKGLDVRQLCVVACIYAQALQQYIDAERDNCPLECMIDGLGLR